MKKRVQVHWIVVILTNKSVNEAFSFLYRIWSMALSDERLIRYPLISPAPYYGNL